LTGNEKITYRVSDSLFTTQFAVQPLATRSTTANVV